MICHPYSLVLVVSAIFLSPLFAYSQEKELSPAEEVAASDAKIKPEDRTHWSYLPIRNPQLPEVERGDWGRNPIDRFVLARLEAKDWQPSQPAKPLALLRRVYLDVIGIPPTLEEQELFLADTSSDALDRIVDRLLARPGYGERWGRHWLDVVRYAETNGYERDATKPMVWRYRDYVIRSLNKDKPYDRFVLEQLAGDELEDATTETVLATGFNRLGPWDDEPADPKQDRFDQLDDLVRTTSRAFLGLTLGCARCHDHKFDALTAVDYYRMVAVFNPLQRSRGGRREESQPAAPHAVLAEINRIKREIGNRQTQIDQLRSDLRAKYLETNPDLLPEKVISAFQTEENKRSETQKRLVSQFGTAMEEEIAASMSKQIQATLKRLDQEIAELQPQVPTPVTGYFMHERSPQPPHTHLLRRGNATSPGPLLKPGVPTVLVSAQPEFLMPSQYTSRRRLSLARWLVSPKNPLTARVIVNRVWFYHFGQGIVQTPSDFGVLGTEPTHPELLDWLAHWFVHEADWSLKKLHRLILTSSTYRMSKQSHPEYRKFDPENELFWRFPFRRLEVEAIRDSMLAVSGQLNRKMYGPSMYPSVPPDVLKGHSDPTKIWKPLDEQEASRRTIYAFIKRSMVVPMLEVLDLCDSVRSSAGRQVTTVPTQALTLLNSEFSNRQARHFADRILREAGSKPTRQIELAYRLALCRAPTGEESQRMQRFITQEREILYVEAIARDKSTSTEKLRRQALERLCRVIFNLSEFVYPN